MGVRVSAIVPCYQMAGFVARAVRSALDQDGVETEAVVCDDGSTDRPDEVLAPLLREFPDRVRLLHQENRGLPAARNAAVRASRGEFVAFLDADDRWLPHKSRVQTAALDADPAAGWAWGQADARAEEDSSWRHLLGYAPPGDPPRDRLLETVLRTGNMIPVLTGIVRRRVFDEIGGFDESFRRGGEDYDIWLRLAAHSPGVFVPGVVSVYRLHESGFYVSNPDPALDGLDRVHEKVGRAHAGDAAVMDALDLSRGRVLLGRGVARVERGEMRAARGFFERAACRPELRDEALRMLRRTFLPAPVYFAARRARRWLASVASGRG